MSVRVEAWKPDRLRNKWRVDVRFKRPDGEKVRDLKVIEAPSRGSAKKWGEAREAQLRAGTLAPGKPKRAPTWDEFFPRFLADRQGGGTRGRPAKASYLRKLRQTNEHTLSPELGSTPLDKIDDERISQFRASLVDRGLAPKSVNNLLATVSGVLRLAVDWRVLSVMPCRLKLRAIDTARPDFFDFDDYDRLTSAAEEVSTHHHVLVRLGGDAGLRRGEMMALRWGHVDFVRRLLRIEESMYRESEKIAKAEGIDVCVTEAPKGHKHRIVPMTPAIHAALQAHRHLRGEYVLCGQDGLPISGHVLRKQMETVQRRAGMAVDGGLHRLRHTFCSHLAMRGAPAKAIQELAGHESLSTTLRYMHLAPGQLDAAIALLDRKPNRPAKTSAAKRVAQGRAS